MDNIRKYAKFVVALLTAAVGAVTQFALPIPEEVVGYVQLVIAVLGAVAVFGVPNSDPEADPEYDPEYEG